MTPSQLALTIELPEDASIPRGSPLLVELRDTSLADAPAVTLQRVRSTLDSAAGRAVRVTLKPESIPDGTTIWAHLDVDRDGRVSAGDYITVQSYPVAERGPRELKIQLKRV